MPNRENETFALLTFAGLGGVAADELGIAPGGRLPLGKLRNYDFVPCVLAPEEVSRLPALRTVEDVFWLMGAPQGVARRHDLGKLDALVRSPAILRGLELRNRLFHPGKPKRPTFNCFVKQDRDQEVYRKDIAAQVNAAIAAEFPKWQNRDPATVEVWAFYLDNHVHLGFRLSDERMKYRGAKPVLREGALRPTVAAAMIRVAAPQPGETVLDPMCGTGTILVEGLARGAGASFRGGDIDAEAVALAATRLGPKARVERWDAAALPLAPGSVDCLVCNLPFGKQYSTRDANRELYPALLGNWVGKLKRDGRMVLLTADGNALEAALAHHHLTWSVAARVNVLGEWAKIYQVRA